MTAHRTAFVKMPRDWTGQLAPGRYVWRRPRAGQNSAAGWTPIAQALPLIEPFGRGPNIISDIEPYRAMVGNGRMVTSRSQHRALLREHGCIEVGNEMPKGRPPVDAKANRRAVHEALKRTKEILNVTSVNVRG